MTFLPANACEQTTKLVSALKEGHESLSCRVPPGRGLKCHQVCQFNGCQQDCSRVFQHEDDRDVEIGHFCMDHWHTVCRSQVGPEPAIIEQGNADNNVLDNEIQENHKDTGDQPLLVVDLCDDLLGYEVTASQQLRTNLQQKVATVYSVLHEERVKPNVCFHTGLVTPKEQGKYPFPDPATCGWSDDSPGSRRNRLGLP